MEKPCSCCATRCGPTRQIVRHSWGLGSYEAVGQCVRAVEGCRGRTQCEERCEYGEHMCSPLHYRLPDTTQQHQTHHGYSYPSSSHLSSHWVRPLQPSTAVTHCATASYPLQHFYNTLQHSTTLYSLQLYSISTVYNLYNTPLEAIFFMKIGFVGRLR